MTAPAPLRVGVLGLGMAGGVMSPVIAAHPGLILAAAADREPLLRARFAADHDALVFETAEDLLANGAVDAVYIATPHHLHRAHAVLAARHGKHIVVEKPMALSLEDCDAMLAAARSAGVALIVGHTHGFDPTIGAMRDVIENGAAGRPRVITSMNYTNFIYRPRRPEELDAAQGGGVVWNQLPHQIDMIRSLIAAPVASVRAVLHTLDEARGVEALCAAFLTFADGAAASITYGGYDRFDTDQWHDWVGESGNQKAPSHGAARAQLETNRAGEEQARTARYGYGGEMYRAFDAAGAPHFGALVVSCENADLVQTPRGFDLFDAAGRTSIAAPISPKRPAHHGVWDELIAAASNGRAMHDGAFGRATVEVVLAIIASARSGREIFLAGADASAPQE